MTSVADRSLSRRPRSFEWIRARQPDAKTRSHTQDYAFALNAEGPDIRWAVGACADDEAVAVCIGSRDGLSVVLGFAAH